MAKTVDSNSVTPDDATNSQEASSSPVKGPSESSKTSRTGMAGVRREEKPSMVQRSRELSPEWTRPKQAMSPEEQAEWERVTREMFELPPLGDALVEQAAEQQVSTREQEIIEAREKAIADNIKLGGRPDDHPLIMKWRTELGRPRRPATKYLTAAVIGAFIVAAILAFFGLWGPAGIAVAGAVVLFVVATVWQSVRPGEREGRRRDKEQQTRSTEEFRKAWEKIHHPLEQWPDDTTESSKQTPRKSIGQMSKEEYEAELKRLRSQPQPKGMRFTSVQKPSHTNSTKLNRDQIEQEAKRNLPKDLDPEALMRAVESVKSEYQNDLNSLRARPQSREHLPIWDRPKEPLTPEQQAQWEEMTREAFEIGPESKD